MLILWLVRFQDELEKKAAGSVMIRLFASQGTEPLTPPQLPKSAFSYRQHKSEFKTGDLIVFQERGLLGTVNSMLSNSPYSRVGSCLT
jgi:hypothetical protein